MSKHFNRRDLNPLAFLVAHGIESGKRVARKVDVHVAAVFIVFLKLDLVLCVLSLSG